MQKGKEATAMPAPKNNPRDSDPETEAPLLPPGPTKTAHQAGSETPLVSLNQTKASEEESKSEEESAQESHERRDSTSPPNTVACTVEEEGTRSTTAPTTKSEGTVEENSSGRERLKRHRVEVAGRVWIPDMWGQEDLLKDWIDCTAFDATLMNSSIISARASLVEEGRRPNSTTLGVENSC